MTEQSHLQRCDLCQSLRTSCPFFCSHRFANPRQLLCLKGPAVAAAGADLGRGVLRRVAPLIQGHLGEL